MGCSSSSPEYASDHVITSQTSHSNHRIHPDEKEAEEMLSTEPSRAVARSLLIKKEKSAHDIVIETATSGGAIEVLKLLQEHQGDSEFAIYCFDALAGLCAGKPEVREIIYQQGGTPLILSTMRLFTWNENVLAKAVVAVTALASDNADYVGRIGGVDAVISAIRNCPESYHVQVGGSRSLQVLISKSPRNTKRAIEGGARSLLLDALERYPDDGQLQWRITNLISLLDAPPQLETTSVGAGGGEGGGGGNKRSSQVRPDSEHRRTSVSGKSAWNKVKNAVMNGHAKELAAGQIPGQHGISLQVADLASNLDPTCAVKDVLAFLQHHKGYHEAEAWCCDALSTLIRGNTIATKVAYEAGSIESVLSVMREAVWEEHVQIKCFWALQSLASSYPTEIGTFPNAFLTIVGSMVANKTSHEIQVAAVKLISTIITSRNNTTDSIKSTSGDIECLRLAREASAEKVIKAVIDAHSHDVQLQYLGVNLLEKLKPGATETMPGIKLVRTASLRTMGESTAYRNSRLMDEGESKVLEGKD
jgi:hypothetical protein